MYFLEKEDQTRFLMDKRDKDSFQALQKMKKTCNKNVQKWAIFLTVKRLSMEAVKNIQRCWTVDSLMPSKLQLLIH